MDIIKSGSFICERRKKLGLTQKELADKIGVTDKAVSKWENGRGFPDVSLLTPLAEILEVSVTEILNGEAAADNGLKAADKLLIKAYNDKKTIMNIFSAILVIAGIGIILLPVFTAGTSINVIISLIIGAILIAVSILISTYRFIAFLSKIKLVKLCIPFSFAAIIGAIAIEAIPGSYIMAFAAPPGEEPLYEYVSYFDPLPFGYGHLFPLMTAISSCLAAILVFILLTDIIIVRCLKRKAAIKGKTAVIVTSVLAFFSTLANLILSSKITSPGIIIMLLLILSAVLQFVRLKSQ